MDSHAVKTCLYCGTPNTMTGEHVVAECFFLKGLLSKDHLVVDTTRKNTFPAVNYEIKKVCGDCNSRILSQLDMHANQVLSPICAGPIRHDEEIALNNENDKLGKWAIKTAVNALAANSRLRPECLALMSDTVLGRHQVGKHVKVFCALLVSSGRLSSPIVRFSTIEDFDVESGASVVRYQMLFGLAVFEVVVNLSGKWPEDYEVSPAFEELSGGRASVVLIPSDTSDAEFLLKDRDSLLDAVNQVANHQAKRTDVRAKHPFKKRKK